MTSTFTTQDAQNFLRAAGYVSRVSANGLGLVVYEGQEDKPGSWMEFDRLAIQDGFISGASLDHVIGA